MRKISGLYDSRFEHDACGVGFTVNIDGTKSHKIVEDGVQILCNLEHRGAVGGDMKTGDGAGMLLQIPHRFFRESLKIKLPGEGEYGVGMLFLPETSHGADKAKELINQGILQEGGTVLHWREVPVNPKCLGKTARSKLPSFWQVFIAFEGNAGDELERKLYVLRKVLEKQACEAGWDIEDFYIPSMSSKTIVYKGMFVAPQFVTFYPDLTDSNFSSAFALVHQRYSTNTFPSWPLSQPFRQMAHNGEINTIRRNVNNMKARENNLSSPFFEDEVGKLLPIVNEDLSDSGIFDNVFELMALGGRTVEHAAMMMIPEAFGTKFHISQDKRAFFEYHAAIMEPWDGPAAIAFTDGVKIGAILDRNGLRPIRYVVTKSGRFIMASEVGVLPVDPRDVREKGRLAPGKMILVDTERKRVIKDNEIKSAVSRGKPYRRWLEENRIELMGLFQVPGPVGVDKQGLRKYQQVMGYTLEDLKTIITPMVLSSQEPLGSMGNDESLAVLSEKPRLLYDYFRQMFAQVTNPPIDPYRESLVMSLMSFVGRERNLLSETNKHCRQLKLSHPVLTNDDVDRLRASDIEGFRVCTVPMLFPVDSDIITLGEALDKICAEVEERVDQGYSLVILSDRKTDSRKAPVPALLGIGAVHHYLVRKGKRHLTGLIVESGEVREVHHFATLIGYGASGINPYLVFETIVDLRDRGYLPEDMTTHTAIEHYISAVKKGLLKVMSKMGVSTIRSYRGSQLYEIIGLSQELVDNYFSGTPTPVNGIGLEAIEGELRERHSRAFLNNDEYLEQYDAGGRYNYRGDGEKHLFTPEAVALLQKSVREGDYDLFKKYSREINNTSRHLCTLRGLFSFSTARPVPLEEVEPEEEIVKRFVSSAMSFGSLSREAHETIAVAMNRLGAQSNSGEGGEDEERYTPKPNGDSAISKVKQVASARFGVSINYLVNARELQIKMAQGAKPGEGGQLPGHKVNDEIAKTRSSTVGVGLISPPPHHDIYSIEDLAQLIFDLKNANPDARVSVKLVSEIGVGTVAAGVAKGKADMVLISGCDGGTGSSPLSSIKYAGSWWEIGLAETQQVLVMNNLRNRIRVQVDGQLKTGRDVVIGALLGAEEFGFGTTTLVSLGCVLMRKCHLNSCPVGIATQDERLRNRFQGKPEHLMNFMLFIARETREIMAELGFRSMDEMVGRVEMLEFSRAVDHYKAKGLDLTKLLKKPEGSMRHCTESPKHDFSDSLDEGLVEEFKDSIEKRKKKQVFRDIRNCNRTVGAYLSSIVTRSHGSRGLPGDTINVHFIGSAGQSFGAFLAPGISFTLEGDANDYLGKGLSGGKLIVFPPKESTFRSYRNSITGNVNLFGATGGEAFISGMAGERFCVRNSGANAVVEGVGDHGCEYMTGGRVIVLGDTGVNFAAGMSGGIAYVLDESQLFDTRCNLELVDVEPVVEEEDSMFLKNYIERHVNYTNSLYAARILERWEEMLPLFVKVMPLDYRLALQKMREQEWQTSESVEMIEEVYV